MKWVFTPSKQAFHPTFKEKSAPNQALKPTSRPKFGHRNALAGHKHSPLDRSTHSLKHLYRASSILWCTFFALSR
jgi:hypothetical protein